MPSAGGGGSAFGLASFNTSGRSFLRSLAAGALASSSERRGMLADVRDKTSTVGHEMNWVNVARAYNFAIDPPRHRYTSLVQAVGQG